MPSTPSLRNRLASDHPSITFIDGIDYRWDPSHTTISVNPEENDPAALLHELAHAVLEHTAYRRDINLLAMERDAWSYAVQTLAPQYGVTIDDDTVQEHLDTYRDWLHARSRCPRCTATGIQSSHHSYTCLACRATWQVNDARTCALRRYTTPVSIKKHQR